MVGGVVSGVMGVVWCSGWGGVVLWSVVVVVVKWFGFLITRIL